MIAIALSSISCSIPNLESADCSSARDSAKQFYSFHFANDMQAKFDNFKARERFLTPRFFTALSGAPESVLDPFTLTTESPRTFKIAECRQESTDNIDLNIQLYWRDDTRTEQKAVQANMVRQNGAWLLDGVGSKRQ